jgi:hypothetical protein
MLRIDGGGADVVGAAHAVVTVSATVAVVS